MNIDFKKLRWFGFAVAALAITVGSSVEAAQRAALFGELKSRRGGVQVVQFSPDGRRLLTGSEDGSVKTWSVPDRQQLERVCGTSQAAATAAFSPDGQYVVTGHDEDELHVHDAHSGKLLYELEGMVGLPLSIDISQDGRYIAAAGTGKTLTVWRGGDEGPMYQVSAHERSVSDVEFSPDGEFVATVGDDGSLRVWEVMSGYLVFSVKLAGPLNDIAFTPTGQHVLVAGDNVRMIELKSSSIVRTFEGHGAAINQVSVSPGGKYIVTASSDRTARLWSVETGRVLEVFDELGGKVTSAAFSPDGNYIALGSDAGPIPGAGQKEIGSNGVAIWNISEVYADGRISRFVERQLYHWQRKGEFEKQTDYEKRLASAASQAGKLFSKAYRMYSDEVQEGARIGVYNPDSERFTIHLPALGAFSLRVPLEKAETFKKRFNEVVYRNFVVEPDVRVPDRSSWRLRRVELYLPSAKQSFFYESVE